MYYRTLIAFILLTLASVRAETLVPPGSTWRYWDNGSEPAGWNTLSYVEPSNSPWEEGPAELGYGDGDEITTVSFGANASQKYVTTYFRTTFEISSLENIPKLKLKLLRDDGAVVYINGIEVHRANLPSGTISYGTWASSAIEETLDQVLIEPSALVAGLNVLAVEVHQANASSSDLSFDLELEAVGEVVRGPYLQKGTPTSVVVRWRTVNSTDSVVRYGTTPEAATWVNASNPASTTEHEVTLSGLKPDTAYYYSVGTTSAVLAEGADFIFYTSPVDGSDRLSRIWVLGDSGTADANARAVRDAYYNYSDTHYTDLLLMLGDNAYHNGEDDEYQAAVYDMYPDILRQTVLWPTIGNHDTAGASSVTPDLPYFKMFTLPTAGEAGGAPSGTEKYYSFNFGNIHFICLDSMTSDRSPQSAMLLWLKADLAENTLPWVIAFWHHPPYSKGSHDSDSSSEVPLIEMRENVLPILDSYNVDLVLSGHSHSYERSYLLDGHYGPSSQFNASMVVDGGSGREDGSGVYSKATGQGGAHEGAVYVVAGSSGKKSGGALNHPAMFLSLNELGSLVIDLNGERLDVKFLRENGTVDDYFSIVKGNNPPVVSITSPSPGTVFAEAATIPITAEASDDGSVTKVQFFANETLIGTDTDAPYEIAWTQVPGGSYQLTVKATDNLASTTVSAPVGISVTDPPPSAPETLAATAVSSSRIDLSWTDLSGNESGFSIERSTDGETFSEVGTIGANVTQFSNTSLQSGVTYYYRVRAFNTGGSSDYSNVASAVTPVPPPNPPTAPAKLSAKASKTQVNLTWTDKSNDETGFEIERATSGGAFQLVGTTGENINSFIDTDVVLNTSYSYRVRALNAGGASAWSNTANARMPRR